MKTDAGDDNLQEAVNIVRDLHMEMDPSLDSDSIINVAVCFDRMWMKQGHKSKYETCSHKMSDKSPGK